MKQHFIKGIFALIFGLSLQSFAVVSPHSSPVFVEKLGDGCAQIVLKTGDVISADITQITENTILYKPCGEKNAEPTRLEKSKILKIKAPTGEVIFKGNNNDAVGGAPITKEKNAMAVAGFVCSLVAGPLIGLILSIIGLEQIKKNPEKYSGEGFATAGIAISLIYLLMLLLLLLSIRR